MRMTGSLDGAQKYDSPRLTSQSSGYEPMSAPAAAISVTTVLALTVICSGTMKANHPVSHGQPLGRGFADARHSGAQCGKRDAPHHQFRATAPNRGDPNERSQA